MDNSGRHGGTIALSKAAQAALLACDSISPRLASAHKKGAIMNLAVIANSLDAEEGVKDSFYDDAQDTVDSFPSGEKIINTGN